MQHRKLNQTKILLLFVLFISLISLGGWYFYQQPAAVISKDLLSEIKDASDRSIDEVAQELADANYFTLNINPIAEFEDGSGEGSIQIINPETNVYPIEVTIVINETGEEIYFSGAIYPNQEILTGKLDRVLAKGRYPATAKIAIFDPETKEKQGITQAEMQIVIHN